jgi:hypothetical protein
LRVLYFSTTLEAQLRRMTGVAWTPSAQRGRAVVRLVAGEAIVLVGGIVPHAIAPLGEKPTRIAAPLCFRPAR